MSLQALIIPTGLKWERTFDESGASFVDTYPSEACLPRLIFTGVSGDLIRDAISLALTAPSPSVAPIVNRNCTSAGSLRNSASSTALEEGDGLDELAL